MTNHVLCSQLMSKFAVLLLVIQLMIPLATPLSFKFPDISRNKGEIILANNQSRYTPLGLQFNPDPDYTTNIRHSSGGRATYIKPLHLWSKHSKKVASFTTTFKFVIDSIGSSEYADGLAFFLAENNTQVTPSAAFGLPVDPITISPVARFVAVEFDTYCKNKWDPENMSYGDHVGIDVNSLSSAAYQKWLTNIPLGLEYKATVRYDSVTKVLSVVFTGYCGTTKVQQEPLQYVVDLAKELPERVIIGISASTGGWTQKNTLKSWTFESTNI